MLKKSSRAFIIALLITVFTFAALWFAIRVGSSKKETNVTSAHTVSNQTEQIIVALARRGEPDFSGMGRKTDSYIELTGYKPDGSDKDRGKPYLSIPFDYIKMDQQYLDSQVRHLIEGYQPESWFFYDRIKVGEKWYFFSINYDREKDSFVVGDRLMPEYTSSQEGYFPDYDEKQDLMLSSCGQYRKINKSVSGLIWDLLPNVWSDPFADISELPLSARPEKSKKKDEKPQPVFISGARMLKDGTMVLQLIEGVENGYERSALLYKTASNPDKNYYVPVGFHLWYPLFSIPKIYSPIETSPDGKIFWLWTVLPDDSKKNQYGIWLIQYSTVSKKLERLIKLSEGKDEDDVVSKSRMMSIGFNFIRCNPSDPKILAVTSYDGILLIDTVAKKVLKTISKEKKADQYSQRIFNLKWSPQGDKIAYLLNDGSISVYDLRTDKTDLAAKDKSIFDFIWITKKYKN
ncbi:MAG: hypothetical protein LWY06_14635 [Firmicutes bacterium]|nr:hypothetical protein [Bacillota bacterium]